MIWTRCMQKFTVQRWNTKAFRSIFRCWICTHIWNFSRKNLNIYVYEILVLCFPPVRLNIPFGIHDDVIKWKHFRRQWPFVRGIHRSPVDSPHKGQWRGASMFSLINTSNKQLSKYSRRRWLETPSRSLWRHCNVRSDCPVRHSAMDGRRLSDNNLRQILW